MEILEFLLTLLGVYILYRLVRFFIRYLWPIIVSVRAMKKAQEEFYKNASRGGYNRDYSHTTSRTEGEVTVEKPANGSQQGKVIKDDVGEDTPYEEIK